MKEQRVTIIIKHKEKPDVIIEKHIIANRIAKVLGQNLRECRASVILYDDAIFYVRASNKTPAVARFRTD